MKISAPSTAVLPREPLRPQATARPQRAAQSAPAEVETGTRGPKPAPPGLERVRERLEALGESRTVGQNTALDRIGRNLARYLENQAPAPAPAAAPAVPPLPVEAPAVEELPVAELPAAPEPAPGAEA